MKDHNKNLVNTLPNQVNNIPFQKLPETILPGSSTLHINMRTIISDFTKILVITGHNDMDYLDHAEVIDLSPNKKVCDPIPPFPLKLSGAFGGLFNGNLPTVCTGSDGTNYRY